MIGKIGKKKLYPWQNDSFTNIFESSKYRGFRHKSGIKWWERKY
jgi:hypothetical protein